MADQGLTQFVGSRSTGGGRGAVSTGSNFFETQHNPAPTQFLGARHLGENQGAVGTTDNRFEAIAVGGAVGDNAPTISNFVPAVGTTLGRLQSVAFDITDPDGDLQRGAVWVEQGSDVLVCHDGDTFRGSFSGTRTPVENGFRYSVSRAGGWISAPTFTFHVTDEGGNEAV